MKKTIAILLSVMLMLSLPGAALAAEEAPEGADIAAVFAQQKKQPFARANGSIENLNTVWIYFTDGSFVQYAFIDGEYVVFSEGNYSLPNGSDFHKAEDESNEIVIGRTAKYADGKGLQPYSSEHTYRLTTLGFQQLFALREDGKRIVAIFAGANKQAFMDGQMLDTYWLYFDDMSFAQYACPGSDPILFSEGSYALTDGKDFHFGEDEEDFGAITITRTMKFQPGLNYAPYSSEHTYDLGTLGFTCLVRDEK